MFCIVKYSHRNVEQKIEISVARVLHAASFFCLRMSGPGQVSRRKSKINPSGAIKPAQGQSRPIKATKGKNIPLKVKIF
jgi:hypothetical protein